MIVMDYETRLCYAPAFVKVSFCGTDDAVKNQFESLLKKQICLVCYKEAKSVKEMSNIFRMDAIYIKEAVDELEANKLLKLKGKKYLTNFCMIPFAHSQEAYSIKHKYLLQNNFPERVQKLLLEKKEAIVDLGFYGCDFDYNYLLWILYYIISSEICRNIRKKYFEKKAELLNIPSYSLEGFSVKAEYEYAEENNRLEKKDFAENKKFSTVVSKLTTTDFGECQFYKVFNVSSVVGNNENNSGEIKDDFIEMGDEYERTLIYLKKGYIDHGELSLLLNIIKNKQSFTERELKSLEIMEKVGLVKKVEDKYKCMIPVFTKSQMKKLCKILDDSASVFADEIYENLGCTIENELISYIRKEEGLLHHFYYNWLVSYINPVEELFEYGLNDKNFYDCISTLSAPDCFLVYNE